MCVCVCVCVCVCFSFQFCDVAEVAIMHMYGLPNLAIFGI